jgi:hypothetical protein
LTIKSLLVAISSAARFWPHLRGRLCPPPFSANCVDKLRPLINSIAARFRPLLGYRRCPPVPSSLNYVDQISPVGDLECRTISSTSQVSALSSPFPRAATASIRAHPFVISSAARPQPLLRCRRCLPTPSSVNFDNQISPGGDLECRNSGHISGVNCVHQGHRQGRA